METPATYDQILEYEIHSSWWIPFAILFRIPADWCASYYVWKVDRKMKLYREFKHRELNKNLGR
jgi:hypothetical protein